LPPRQVQEVDTPLLIDPVTVPVEQVLATVPHAPLMGPAAFETEHEAFDPLLLPLQVHEVVVPLFVDPVTVPVEQVLATVPHAPLMALETEHEAFDPLLLPLQVHEVVVPLFVDPVTVPVEQVLATVPHAPLMGAGAALSDTEHQAFDPLLLPRQVQDVEMPLFVDPVTVPAEQVAATVPHTPLAGAAAAVSATEHQAFDPLLLPTQVQEVDTPLFVDPVTVPAEQVLAAVPHVPLTAGDATGS